MSRRGTMAYPGHRRVDTEERDFDCCGPSWKTGLLSLCNRVCRDDLQPPHGRDMAHNAALKGECRRSISFLYRQFQERTGIEFGLAATWMTGQDNVSPVTREEQRNEKMAYLEVFSLECRAEVEVMYRASISQLRLNVFQESIDTLNALMFLQEIVATALWKHNCQVGAELENFARTYDRLDTPSDRLRLHLEAQRARL